MKTKTPKKKPVKPARPIPPPPPGWEIVGKDDPRLRKLPCKPRSFIPDYPELGWSESGYKAGETVGKYDSDNLFYALPIATRPAQPQPQPPMIRLRLPSEKPTREDGDFMGEVAVFCRRGTSNKTYVVTQGFHDAFPPNAVFWLPGCLPDGILPREPSQEERWRAEFEEKFNSKYPDGSYKEAAWQGFLAAAKKGGAE